MTGCSSHPQHDVVALHTIPLVDFPSSPVGLDALVLEGDYKTMPFAEHFIYPLLGQQYDAVLVYKNGSENPQHKGNREGIIIVDQRIDSPDHALRLMETYVSSIDAIAKKYNLASSVVVHHDEFECSGRVQQYALGENSPQAKLAAHMLARDILNSRYDPKIADTLDKFMLYDTKIRSGVIALPCSDPTGSNYLLIIGYPDNVTKALKGDLRFEPQQ